MYKIYKTEAEAHIDIARKCKSAIVEIGVLNGETSALLASANPFVTVYGIDPIIPDSMDPKMIGSIEKIKENTGNLKNFVFIKDYSYNVVKNFKEKIDYIFIDGSHIYEDVRKDYEDWFPLVSIGGFIAFHDSAMYRGGLKFFPGPSRLADELIASDKCLELIDTVLTMTIFKKIKDRPHIY